MEIIMAELKFRVIYLLMFIFTIPTKMILDIKSIKKYILDCCQEVIFKNIIANILFRIPLIYFKPVTRKLFVH